MKGYLDVKELEGYKKADIQKLARDLGVSDAGTIKEIANYQTVFINYLAVCQHDTLCYGVVGVVVLIPLYTLI